MWHEVGGAVWGGEPAQWVREQGLVWGEPTDVVKAQIQAIVGAPWDRPFEVSVLERRRQGVVQHEQLPHMQCVEGAAPAQIN
eukprot:12438641-Alexandrium_andersonii.AAC.1